MSRISESIADLVEVRGNDLSDALSDLTPSEWRHLLMAVGDHRCIACGEFDACECSDRVDEAKSLVTCRAIRLEGLATELTGPGD